MSTAKRHKPENCECPRCTGDTQEHLRSVKIEAEQLKEKLQNSVMESPKFSKKAALLISLWIAGQDKKRKNQKK